MPVTMIVPVKGSYTLTAKFGQSGSRWENKHTGQDFAAPTGTPVVAAAGGMVTSVSSGGPYGNRIEITHANGMVTTYSHLSKIEVSRFQPVGQGDVIGKVGETGNTTGAHLHFEVKVGGQYVDPMKYIGTATVPDEGFEGVQNPDGSSADSSLLTAGGTWLRVAYFLGGTGILVLAFIAIRKGGLK